MSQFVLAGTLSGTDISEYQDMIYKAQLIKYIAEEIPTTRFGENGAVDFQIGRDANGILTLTHKGTEIGFAAEALFVDWSCPIEMLDDFVEAQLKSAGDIWAQTIASTLLSIGIGALWAMTFGAPTLGVGAVALTVEGLGSGVNILNAATTGIGFGVGLGRSFAGMNGSNEALLRLRDDTHVMAIIALLGGETYMIIGPDGKRLYFGTNFNTVDNAIWTNGFVNTSDLARQYNLTRAELEAIVMNLGNAPIDRLDHDAQAEIFKAYAQYHARAGNYSIYEDELRKALEKSESVKKEDIYDCTPEELQQLALENAAGVGEK